MNIKQAKQEIINTVQAYLTKDETGEYAIPVERQRPVLLIGPPGIGKTAIMEQVAQEDQSGFLYDHAPYETECDRTAVYLEENL